MRNRDILKRLESITVPDITLESHRYELKASLLEEYASIQDIYDRKGLTGWLGTIHIPRRVRITAVPVTVILVTFLVLQLSGFFVSPSGVLARAYAATERVESYRIVSYEYIKFQNSDNKRILVSRSETEYTNPNRYHIFYDWVLTTTTSSEMIVIEDQVYSTGMVVIENQKYLAGGLKPRSPEEIIEGLPSRTKTLELLDLLDNLEEFQDEYIDDVLCYHYRGVIDMVGLLEKNRTELLKLIESYWTLTDKDESEKEEYLEEALMDLEDKMRKKEMIYDVWIGKDDYIVRQIDLVMRSLSGTIDIVKENMFNQKYRDFNEEIIIVPPLTETGELKEGWHETSMDSWLSEN